MNPKQLSDLTDQELLQEAKKLKKASLLNAFLIGFLLAIVVYSFVKNTWGLLTLIPLYFAYKLINSPKQHKEAVEKLLKERKLK
jgi:hypothetical protein